MAEVRSKPGSHAKRSVVIQETVDRTFRGMEGDLADKLRIEAANLNITQVEVLNERLRESFERIPVQSRFARSIR